MGEWPGTKSTSGLKTRRNRRNTLGQMVLDCLRVVVDVFEVVVDGCRWLLNFLRWL